MINFWENIIIFISELAWTAFRENIKDSKLGEENNVSWSQCSKTLTKPTSVDPFEAKMYFFQRKSETVHSETVQICPKVRNLEVLLLSVSYRPSCVVQLLFIAPGYWACKKYAKVKVFLSSLSIVSGKE